MQRRDLLKLAALGPAAAVLAPSVRRAADTAATFVLVHGSWCGGWFWRRVADRLRAAGHAVYTPSHTGLGDRAHLISRDVTLDTFIQDIINVIETEELSDVILVGHSSGGLPMTGVADRIPGALQHLVYVDTGVPQNGRSFFDLAAPETVAARTKAAQETSGGVSVPAPSPTAFGVTEPKDIAWLERRLTPHPFNTYTTPLQLSHPVGNGLPRTYIACVAPPFPGSAAAHAWVRQQPDWGWLEIASPHAAPVVAPQALTQLLLGIAQRSAT